MDGLTPEQQTLFANIMGAAKPAAPPIQATIQTVEPADNPNRVLSQAEIDALIASMNT